MSVRPGLTKSEPTNSAEALRQPIFGNPLITNQEGKPLGINGKSEGNALANAGHTRVRDLWDSKEKEWKGLTEMGVSFHPTNRKNRDLIIASIPWDPVTHSQLLKGPKCGPKSQRKKKESGHAP
jgi:hypothetical protein